MCIIIISDSLREYSILFLKLQHFIELLILLSHAVPSLASREKNTGQMLNYS